MPIPLEPLPSWLSSDAARRRRLCASPMGVPLCLRLFSLCLLRELRLVSLFFCKLGTNERVGRWQRGKGEKAARRRMSFESQLSLSCTTVGPHRFCVAFFCLDDLVPVSESESSPDNSLVWTELTSLTSLALPPIAAAPAAFAFSSARASCSLSTTGLTAVVAAGVVTGAGAAASVAAALSVELSPAEGISSLLSGISAVLSFELSAAAACASAVLVCWGVASLFGASGKASSGAGRCIVCAAPNLSAAAAFSGRASPATGARAASRRALASRFSFVSFCSASMAALMCD